ncbi:MFS transporter, DHA2 family, multidrug resistance protein [Moraxella cuniculi DSM 21768]|uniref:MFS transporter, DHA2 family, multidrug resistance protein n=1 Tax=Moraxella cuniculi DSM 21768 TaxID=1122245 RepID=A0A1N7FI78_9GAMM|nr:MFS transporter [Moraxella cuniculi]OOS02264.1 MFS transporter [Moraxella cuniculi]SIR99990.1 MFS transporter, DHA2 family, multidrug resistance protein [Moraxella cuniculi DSM 21768]
MGISSQTQELKQFHGNDKLLIGMVLGVLTFWLFYQSIFNVVPSIQQDLNMNDSSLNAVISLGSLFSGCFIILMGGLADRFGRVRLTYIGFALNILACLVLYFSNSAFTFGIGRILQGLSSACIMPATLSIIKNYYHGAARQRAFSFWSIGSFGGSGLSSFVGGAIATLMGWKSIFLLSIAISIIGALLIKDTPESKSNKISVGRYDYIGLFSCILGLLSLNLLITKGFRLGLTHQFTLIMLTGAVMMSIVFFRTEIRQQSNAFLDFSLFRSRGYSGACLSNFLLNCMAGTIIIINTYLQQGHGLTAFEAGVKSLGYVAMVMIMIRVSEKLLHKFGYKIPMWLGTVITTIGTLGLSMTFVSHEIYMWWVIISFAIFGLGLGCYSTPAADCAMVNVPMDKAGVAAGVFKMASALGASFGIATGATIFSVFKNGNIHVAAQYALLTMVFFGILATLVVTVIIPKASIKPEQT